MNGVLTLNKKVFDGSYISIGEEWISNGHWAIKKVLFRQKELIHNYDSFIAWWGRGTLREEAGAIDKMPNILPKKKEELKEYKITPWGYKEKARAFQSEDGGVLLIDMKYVDSFRLESLWTAGVFAPCYNAPIKKDIGIVVMPIRGDGIPLPVLKKESGPIKKGLFD